MKSRKSSIREIVTIWALPIASFFFIPIPSTAQTDPTGSYQIPVQLDDGWKVASLESVGIDTEKIQALTHQWQTEVQFDRIRSMLIVKDGKLVHEAYSRYHQRNTLHVLASITKTFTSTLIGIAIDRGFIDGVDAAVVDLFPEFADVWKDPAKKKIKLRHIMSMKWIKEATQNHKPPGSGRNQYGYNWTPGSMLVNGIRFKYIAAFGYGGQNLYLVPEYDLILVFTCDLEDGNAGVHIPIQKTFQAIIH